MPIKQISELTDMELDWAVYKALNSGYLWNETMRRKYSSDWTRGGPLLENEIHTLIERNGVWSAECYYPKRPSPNRFCYSMTGPTALVAAMRAFVVSRIGPSIEVPAGL